MDPLRYTFMHEFLSACLLPAEIRQCEPRIANIRLTLPDEGIDLEEIEKEILVQALEKHRWNQTHAATYLNISRNTINYRMEKFSLIAPISGLAE